MTTLFNFAQLTALVALVCSASPCWAEWDCDDWVERRGYCVDYIKERIPSFPVPSSNADVRRLKNRELSRIRKGDVAFFNMGRYWHVAYVEKVHRDSIGTPVSVDVIEKNFGPRMTAEQYRATWGPAKKDEWKRAVWCGVTQKYDQVGRRGSIPVHTVYHVWTAHPSLLRRMGLANLGTLLDRARWYLGNLEIFPPSGPRP